jgi:hypothetical protein
MVYRSPRPDLPMIPMIPTEMRSELDMQLRADRPGLTPEDQAVPQVVGLEYLARRHVDLTLDQGCHARAAATFPARVRYVDTGVDQHVDQGLTMRPAKPVALTVEVDLDMCDF